MPAARKPAAAPLLTVAYATPGSANPPKRKASVIPDNIGHQAAQAELNAAIFPHYLLGRQLALEEVVREMLLLLPAANRAQVVERLQFHADDAIERIEAGIADQNERATTCGYVCTLLQQGA